MFRQNVDKNFMSRSAPSNYVAGLGRGAAGFTTRSDIGEALKVLPEGTDPAKVADNKDPDNETGLFASLPYEADDEEADRIYDQVDQKMDDRRRVRREVREREELAKLRKETPKIQQQFSDLKRQLATLSNDEWANIPEVGDLTRKKSRRSTNKMADRFTPVPDSVLLTAHRQAEFANSVDMKVGDVTPVPSETSTDFAEFGQARDRVLGLKLDQITDSVSGSSTVDPKGYLTDLGSIAIKSNAEISDIKKARGLLQSVINTNPTHAPGWIAAARLEEVAGKQVRARELVAKGCLACSKSEDIWLEAARLNSVDNSKVILANAVRELPQSVKIWLKATEIEIESSKKKKVLRRALEFIPNSVKIWKAAISLEEDPSDARILLSRATECVPLSIDLWLALARLESYKNAQKVLNKARSLNKARFEVETLPSHEIWIAAARLEDLQGNADKVEIVIKNAVKILADLGSNLDRELWLKEAENCEKNNSLMTCQAIIRSTIGINVEEDDRKSTWIEDAEGCVVRGSFATARAIYAYAISVFPTKKSVWRRAAFFEKSHGSRASLEVLLQHAVEACPNAEVLWLMAAKEKWLASDISGARAILEAAYTANKFSEQIWLAVIKLEVETGNYEEGRKFLASARESADTDKVWMKSAMLERQLGNYQSAIDLLDQALQKFPKAEKLWMIKGQIQDLNFGNIGGAREAYSKGLKECPNCIPLWLLATRLEEKAGLLTKARPILVRGRLLNSQEPELWLEAVQLERRDNNISMAKALLAKGLQECPNSGILWSEMILMEDRPQRKARSADAIRKCENNIDVIITVARLFFAERKVDKARSWFRKSVRIDPDNGDAWGWLYKFEGIHGDEESRAKVKAECITAEPKHGRVFWQITSKNLANSGMTTEQILEAVVLLMEEFL